MALSDAQLLAAIDAAIEGNTEGILEYEYNGRRVVRMKLTELLEARAMIAARVQRANAGGMFRVARPLRPSGGIDDVAL